MSRIALRCGLIAVFLGGVHQPLAFADIGDIGGAVGGVLKSATNGDADIFNSKQQNRDPYRHTAATPPGERDR